MAKWTPRLAPKQLDCYESNARTKFAHGPRYSGKTWAFEHLVLQHCWRHEARFAIVPKTNKVALSGIWEELSGKIYPEWAKAGIASKKAKFGWVRAPYTNPLTKVLTAELYNRHGTISKIQIYPVEHEHQAKDKFFSTQFSGAWLSEAHLWQSDTVYTEVSNQLRLPGVPFEDQLMLVDANPPEEGRRHWLYSKFVEPTMPTEFRLDAERVRWELEQRTTKVWGFTQADNPYGDPNILLGYNVRYGSRPLEYKRFVLGEWLDGTEVDLCFRSVWSPAQHVVGNADSVREEEWEVMTPSAGTHSFRIGGAVALVDGWDAGDVNFAWAGIQPWTDAEGRWCFDILDEHVLIKQQVPTREFASQVLERIRVLEKLADVPVEWIGYTDDSAEQFRAAADLPVNADATDGAVIEAVIGRPLRGSTQVKKPGWQRRRVNFLADLLAQGRIRVSAQCRWTQKMFENLRKDTSEKAKTYLATGQDEKHIFDAISYPIAMLCLNEILEDSHRPKTTTGRVIRA